MNRSEFLPKLALALLVAASLYGLHLLIRQTGYRETMLSMWQLGIGLLWIALAFLPQFLCLSLAWWVVIDARPNQKGSFFLTLFGINLVTFAWNNISPFSKSMGEPGRAYLLSRYVPMRTAIRSVIFFNLTQALGTLFAFTLAALLAPLFFSLSKAVLTGCMAAAFVAFSLQFFAFGWILKSSGRKARTTKGRRFREVWHWIGWIGHQIRKFSRSSPRQFLCSILFCLLSRYAESLIFLVAFRYLGQASFSFLDSVAVDIGRGITDNAMFFVPYQLGTREYSVVYLTKYIVGRGAGSAVLAALAFRLGEIIWTLLGLLLWPLSRWNAPPKPKKQEG